MAEVSETNTRENAERKRDPVSESVGNSGNLCKQLSEQTAAKSHHRKRERIIEYVLHGVHDPRILHGLQQTVDKTAHNAFSDAEHIRIQRYRKKRKEGYRTAVRRLEQSDIRKTERQRDADRRIYDRGRMRSARVLLGIDHHKHDEKPDHEYRKQRDEQYLILFGVRLARFEIEHDVDDRHHDRIKKRNACADERSDLHLVALEEKRQRKRNDDDAQQDKTHAERRTAEIVEIEIIFVIRAQQIIEHKKTP